MLEYISLYAYLSNKRRSQAFKRMLTGTFYRLGKSTVTTITMLRFLITLSIGVYAGIYVAQTYEIPRVDEPSKLYQRVVEYLEQNKKKP